MKNTGSFRNSGAYTSPGTPEYGDGNVGGTPKSWHSERVPLATNSSRRHVSAAALMPFNSGRALPSKWDDAERWITSPISGYGACKTSSTVQSHRRPKSKSGPQELVFSSNYSPTMPVHGGGNVRNFTANSPLTTGVLVPEGFRINYDAGMAEKSNSLCAENSMTWSSSVPGLSDLLSETSVPSSQDYKFDGTKEEEALVSRAVSRRDMATQMSPEGSTHSSSKGRLSFSTFPSAISTLSIPHSNSAAKDEVRDVQVDKGVHTARQSKRQGLRKLKDSTNVDDLPSPWNMEEASRNTSRLQREEAKITAWENLQKAKAEAAIQKLEMNLEKKRSKSMDRILNKLRAAQVKAQAMRNFPSENHARQDTRNSRKWISFFKHIKTCSFSHCFRCHRN